MVSSLGHLLLPSTPSIDAIDLVVGGGLPGRAVPVGIFARLLGNHITPASVTHVSVTGS